MSVANVFLRKFCLKTKIRSQYLLLLKIAPDLKNDPRYRYRHQPLRSAV